MTPRLLVLLITLAGLAGPVAAQTIGYADAITLLARSCGADIEKYCAKAHLANFEIGRCLQQNEARISGTCAVDMVRVANALEARAQAQASIVKVCNRDIQKLCPPKFVKPGNGHILQCLLKAQPSVSKNCNAAITNAGYR